MLKWFSFVSIWAQSKESDEIYVSSEDEEDMGFLGARYEAARHIVPDRASHAPLAPLSALSISICPILFLSDRLIESDRLNAACCEVDRIMREAAGRVRIFGIMCSSYLLAQDRLHSLT